MQRAFCILPQPRRMEVLCQAFFQESGSSAEIREVHVVPVPFAPGEAILFKDADHGAFRRDGVGVHAGIPGGAHPYHAVPRLGIGVGADVPGIMILRHLADRLGVENITVSDYGVREGYLHRNIHPSLAEGPV